MKTNSDVSQEILNLEKKYWKAMQDYDLKTALELTDFPCVVAGAHGFHKVDKAEFEKMFQSNQGAIHGVEFDEDKFEVRLISPDTAVSAYQVKSSHTKDGKTVETNAVDTSTWIRKNDKWVCAMHTETELMPQ